MNKTTWIEIIVVLALAAGWFYMEKTESLTIFVKEDMTKEEILAEMKKRKPSFRIFWQKAIC